MEGRRKKSYRDSVLQSQGDVLMGDGDPESENELSDNDDVAQDEDGPWI